MSSEGLELSELSILSFGLKKPWDLAFHEARRTRPPQICNVTIGNSDIF